MKKFITTGIIVVILVFIAYMSFVYFVTFSEGYRSGELIKISKRGVIFKTWEGRLSQGVSEEQQFNFSVESSDKEVLEKLKEYQGSRVKLTYIERYGTFFWMGDTKHYVKEVERVGKDESLEN
ncbi:MAG: 6-phosphogluconate dehydrogenase [Flavobacteriaceae bacterium]|nr:6-phosphogluconate dehydrogenase [Flavobacteriaceae bacterium]